MVEIESSFVPGTQLLFPKNEDISKERPQVGPLISPNFLNPLIGEFHPAKLFIEL
jgi:hypothetical protein